MIRKILMSALAAAALAGCATGYQYRGGSGDYYYGQPRVEYRVYGGYGYGGYYGYPYGYGGYGGYYGYPYGYGGYYYPWYRGHRGHGGHDRDHDHDGDHDGDGGQVQPQRPTPPWRDLGAIGRRGKLPDAQGREAGAPMVRPVAPRPMAPRPISRPSAPRISAPRAGSSDDDSGSRLSEMIRRSKQ